MTSNIKEEPLESPGFRRLKANLGEEGFEALRQDTLRMQREAMEGIPRLTQPRVPDAAHERVRQEISGALPPRRKL